MSQIQPTLHADGQPVKAGAVFVERPNGDVFERSLQEAEGRRAVDPRGEHGAGSACQTPFRTAGVVDRQTQGLWEQVQA
ncbi:MAG TPA: hypothetical protein VMS17_09905, partial [Gemmataceae bacterium]|nr:hypothetical protein [Gemmataceae bacterium]